MSDSLTPVDGDRDCGARRVREQALFTAFLESAPAAVAMFDRDLRYLYASRRWYTDFDLEEQEIIGRLCYEVNPEIRDELKEVHRRVLSGETQRGEVEALTRADGSLQFVRWEARPWYLPSGEIGGMISLSEEITQQQLRLIEIAEDQMRFRAALAIADAAVWEFDANTGKFYASEKLGDLVGQPHIDAAWALSFHSFLHPDDEPGFHTALREFWRGGERFLQDHRLRQPDGSYRWFRSHVSRIGENKGPPTRIIGFLKDISSLKEAELAAREAQNSAHTANVAKSQFLATMSHEIRTPMNGVLGMAAALETTLLSDEQRRMLSVIQSSGEDLLALLNELLDLSKAEAGKIELHESTFFVPELLEKVVALYSETAEAKGNKIALNIDPSAAIHLKGDVVRIRQILNNLISNANKFTERGEIAVSAHRASAHGNVVQTIFAVADKGIGIGSNELEQVFEPFVQVDPSLNRRFEGTGLGLAICKRLAELMQGSISATSERGRGSTFCVTLPLALAKPAYSVPASAPESHKYPSDDRPVCILVAEDNQKNQFVIQSMLRAAGLEMAFAQDGNEAVERWREGGIDLILMDVRMPVADGLWATRRIRDLERELDRAHTPIIALTADATKDGIAKALDAGVDAHLAKPVRPKPLLGAIADLIRPQAD